MNWAWCEKSVSQMELSGEKMPCVLVVGDMRTGVSRIWPSRVETSSKKTLGLRSVALRELSGRWKSMGWVAEKSMADGLGSCSEGPSTGVGAGLAVWAGGLGQRAGLYGGQKAAIAHTGF